MNCSSCGGFVENGRCRNCGRSFVMPVCTNPDIPPENENQNFGQEDSSVQNRAPNKKMTVCRTCGAWVAKKAKRCPYCGAGVKKRSFFKFLLGLIIAVIALCAIIITIVGSIAMIRENRPAEATAPVRQSEKSSQTFKREDENEEDSKGENAQIAAMEQTEEAAEPESPGEESITAGPAEGGVNPELKEMLDSYEAFMDGYVEFMQEYEDTDNPLGMMADYAQLMADYASFAEKIDEIDEDALSAEDYAYYVEVMSRVSQKMILASD